MVERAKGRVLDTSAALHPMGHWQASVKATVRAQLLTYGFEGKTVSYHRLQTFGATMLGGVRRASRPAVHASLALRTNPVRGATIRGGSHRFSRQTSRAPRSEEHTSELDS